MDRSTNDPRLIGRCESLFLYSASLILVTTALLKAVTLVQHSASLDTPDPLCPFLSTRIMLNFAALLELLVAGIVLSLRASVASFRWVAWLCSLMLAYRLGLLVTGYQGPCWCLGSPFRWLGLSWSTLDRVALGLLGYMSLGSVGVLIHRFSGRVFNSNVGRVSKVENAQS
jgi:hypothetical protein